MRTLHLAYDDKFLPFVQTVFEEVFPGENAFRILGDPALPLKFVKPGPNVEIQGPAYWRSDEIGRDASGFDLVLVHFMTIDFVEALRRIPDHVAVMWVGWGGDFYDIIAPALPPLLMDETAGLAARARRRHRRKDLVRGIPGEVARRLGVTRAGRWPRESLPDAIRSVASRIDLVWFIPPELELLRAALPELAARNHRICYYSAEHVFEPGPASWSGPDILAGNSATPTNNHAELFRLLAKQDLTGRRVITPLSYGDAYYADEVERIGRRILGNCFSPIRRFMPRDEYVALVASCGTVVMNHVRQQAGTTVAAALYKGARAYIRGESPMYRFYTEMGVRLSTIEQDLEHDPHPFEPPSAADQAQNRRILQDYWGHHRSIQQVRSLETQVMEVKRARAGALAESRAATSKAGRSDGSSG